MRTVVAVAPQRCFFLPAQLEALLLLAQAMEMGRFSRLELDVQFDFLRDEFKRALVSVRMQ